MSAGRVPADPPAKNIRCDAKDPARPRKYLEQNTFSKRGVQVEPELARRFAVRLGLDELGNQRGLVLRDPGRRGRAAIADGTHVKLNLNTAF